MSYLSMFRGDDRVLTVTASEPLTGLELRFTARRQWNTRVLIEKSTDSGITLGDPDTTALITIDSEDTADLTPGALHWDIQVTDTEGEVHTVAAGRLAIKPDITRGEAS